MIDLKFMEITSLSPDAIRNYIEEKLVSWNVILMTYQMQWRMLKLKLIQIQLLKLK